jgi:NAD(P)-dependent dehydrogenase (short-subunit alcohol dehydrogenase family)
MLRVLITGTSRGLGRELALQYLADGAQLTALVRREADAAPLREACPERCRVFVGDLTDDGLRDRLRETLAGAALDLVVNNAGPCAATVGSEDASLAETAAHFQVHCLGVLRVVQGALPALRRGTDPLVVNISSRLASLARGSSGEYRTIHRSLSYPIAKAAQNMLTIQLHHELFPQGIRVVAVHPGALLTGVGSCDAATPVPEGAARLRALFAGLDTACSGVFLDPEGGTIPW